MEEKLCTGYKENPNDTAQPAVTKGARTRTWGDLVRWTLIILGTVFVSLGVVGVFLPLLPTTPFLLLAAACYARSSKRFYNWLLNNRWFGSYIKNYREGRGISLKLKIVTLALLWGTITYSAFFVVDEFYWRIILLVIAVGVTIHILKTRTLRKTNG